MALALGAASVGCSGSEPDSTQDENYGSVQEAVVTRTAPLPVEEVIRQDSITLVVSMKAPLPAPLYLGFMTVTLGSSVSGTFAPGTTSHAGHADVNVGPALFNTLAQTAPPFKIVLTYDSVRRTVSGLDVVIDGSLVSSAANGG